MFNDRIEAKWIKSFAKVFELCGAASNDSVALVSETQSRELNIHLAELGLLSLETRPFFLKLPTPPQTAPVPVRSTGASQVLQNLTPVVNILRETPLIIDCTVEGLLHAPELPEILAGGARVLMISNEHPEALERCMPGPELKEKVKLAVEKIRDCRMMHVSSEAGTDLQINLSKTPATGNWGYTTRPGTVAHWPGGIVVSFPGKKTVNGKLVLDAGDINLTFKRYLEKPVQLDIQDDYVVSIDGEGTDAELFRRYFAAWGDREAYAVSHVGWGMNPGARYESLAMYDQRDTNGTELRTFAGNFLYSTGANEYAGRHSEGHFDLPLRGCTIRLDDEVVVKKGELQGELA
ncbi:uncharacterized protein METZ01_LOCUS156840 [marine metagenome]|uniref:Peptidase M29 aminopeptidase II n=1 Tax=marine metagenome TaxID=408172 RepID=A0A382AR72_9ZZZZ